MYKALTENHAIFCWTAFIFHKVMQEFVDKLLFCKPNLNKDHSKWITMSFYLWLLLSASSIVVVLLWLCCCCICRCLWVCWRVDWWPKPSKPWRSFCCRKSWANMFNTRSVFTFGLCPKPLMKVLFESSPLVLQILQPWKGFGFAARLVQTMLRLRLMI